MRRTHRSSSSRLASPKRKYRTRAAIFTVHDPCQLASDGEEIFFTSSLTKLLYLETCTKKVIDLLNGIRNMVKLRLLYNEDKRGIFHFKASPSQGAKRSSVPNLQTLHTLRACKSCLTNLVRIPDLKKLGLKGSLISASGCSTIPNFGILEQLVTLKVTNLRFDYDQLSALFKLRLPASLRKLTLQDTYLNWEEISVAELENLEVLKLLDGACVEAEAKSGWDTSDLEFPNFKYLKMQQLDIVKWDDQNLQCASLEVLVLEECHRLESIPFNLALSPSLHTMDVIYCNPSIDILAKENAAEHKSQCGNSDLRVLIKSY